MSRVARRLATVTPGGVDTDFAASFTGDARLTAVNTANRFNPANNTPLTVVCFVRPAVLVSGTYYLYVGLPSGAAATDGWFVQRTGATDKFQVGYSNGATYSLVDGFTPLVDTWYMIAAQFNNAADKGFSVTTYNASGVVDTTSQVGTGFINATASAALSQGGGAAGVSDAEARIDKVGIWFATLTGPQLTALWNSNEGLRGNQLGDAGLLTGLQFYWDLDEATGATSWPAYSGGATLAATGTVTRAARANH